MKKCLSFVALLLLSTAGQAGEFDLDACTYNGQPIEARECEGLRQARESDRRHAATKAKEAADAQAARESYLALKAEQQRVQQLADEKRAAQTAEAEKRQQARMAWDAENLRVQSAKLDAMQASEQNARAKAQKACGEDFGKPRVGMALERAKTCLGYARLVGQVNRKDGVASVYTNDRVQLIVMNDKVVAWNAIR